MGTFMLSFLLDFLLTLLSLLWQGGEIGGVFDTFILTYLLILLLSLLEKKGEILTFCADFDIEHQFCKSRPVDISILFS